MEKPAPPPKKAEIKLARSDISTSGFQMNLKALDQKGLRGPTYVCIFIFKL